MKIALFIDDERDPVNDNIHVWVIVRSSEQAIKFCEKHGVPSYISFDHDLGNDDTSMAFIHWLVEKDMDMGESFIPHDFTFYVHSQNPIGQRNIQQYLDRYLSFRKHDE